MRRAASVLALVAATAVAATSAQAAGKPGVAALQVALRAKGFYTAPIDGLLGPKTRGAVRRFQRSAGLVVDGVVGPRTRRALGRLGRPRLGSRVIRLGQVGWDVAALQFLLARHGFPAGTPDGAFGERTQAAVLRFQRYAGLAVDGVAGPATLAALRRSAQASSALAGESLGARAVAIAKRYLGVPYIWAGESPRFGFDCSGLVMYVYGRLGIPLPHSSSLQWRTGTRIDRADLRAGDLVFFLPQTRGPGHVGIYSERGWFIEAPRRGDVVKISSLTERARALGYVGAVRPY